MTPHTHTLGVTSRPWGFPCRSRKRQEAQASLLIIIRHLSCSRGAAHDGCRLRVPEIHTMHPAPAQLAQDPQCCPPRPCQAAGSALGDRVGATRCGGWGSAGKCRPRVGGWGHMAAGPWHPSGLHESGGDPGLAIPFLWSTLKAERAPPPSTLVSELPTRKTWLSHTHCPRPKRGFPTPWGSGSQKQLRKQAGNKLRGSHPKAMGGLASALDLKLETVNVGITASSDNPSCHRERQPALALRLSPQSSWALILLLQPAWPCPRQAQLPDPDPGGGPTCRPAWRAGPQGGLGHQF